MNSPKEEPMKAPDVKTVKIYAIIESVIDAHGSTPEQIDEFLKNKRFKGVSEIVYNCGGIRTIVVREHIALTMPQLDAILVKA